MSPFISDQNTQEAKNERFFISTTQNNVRIFGIRCLLTKRQTDKQGIKHEMGKTLSSMSLLKIVGEKLPPSQRPSLEIRTLFLSSRY